jgi:hypothetical protein
LKAEAVKDTISRGLDAGAFAYVGKAADGSYKPFCYRKSLPSSEIEIADDVYLISKEAAEAYIAGKTKPVTPPPEDDQGEPPIVPPHITDTNRPTDPPVPPLDAPLAGFRWSGEVPALKWMNFYTKVLTRFATGDGLTIKVIVDIAPPSGVPKSKLNETKTALRELGLNETVEILKKE